MQYDTADSYVDMGDGTYLHKWVHVETEPIVLFTRKYEFCHFEDLPYYERERFEARNKVWEQNKQ